MKLHLPKSLIAALSAVYAAALPLATTVGAGTLLATAATYTAKAEEHTDVSGDTAYTNGDSYQLSGDAKFTGIPGGGTAATIDGTANHYNVTLQAAAAGTQVVNFPILANVGDLTVERGRFLVDELGDFNGVNGGIYMSGGQLWFASAQYTGDNKITQAVTISTCSFTESSVASLERSALRISTNVEISGSLTVEGDGEGSARTRIGFQGGSSLTLTGALCGSSDLGLGAYDTTANSFSILGDSSQFTGALYFQNFNGNVNVTVKAGSTNGLHLGGIHSTTGCAGALGFADGTTEATLTLDVAEGKSYSFDGSIAAGYSIVKTGAGTQAFTNTANELSGSITVTGGTFVYDGTLLNTDNITLNNFSTLTLGGTVNITELINNDAGSLVLKDGVVLKGITGGGTRVARGESLTFVGAASSTYATSDLALLATNTANVEVQGEVARDFSNVVFEDGSTLVIGDGQTIASTPNIEGENASITLEVGEGHTGTWEASAQPPDGATCSVSSVNIGAGGKLIAYAGELPRYCTFNHRKDAALAITVAATPDQGAVTTLETHGSIFGWDNDSGQAERTVNMGKGSQWLLHAVGGGDIWFNQATTVLDNAAVIIEAGAKVSIERYTNKFNTLASSAGQSTISGGTILLKSQSSTKLVFDIARSTALGEGNTADLLVSSLITGATGSDIEKNGDGILELTAANTFTKDIRVNGGTLRLSGMDGKAGTGTVTVAANSTLELAHLNNCTITNSGIVLNGNLLLSSNVRETISGSITGTLQGVTLSAGATLGLSGSGTSISIGSSKLTMDKGSGFYLENNASLTLGGNSDADRVEKMEVRVEGDGTGKLHLNMLNSMEWSTHKVIVLEEKSKIGGVYIDSGCLSMSSSVYFSDKDAVSTNLRGTDLHLANGADLVVTKDNGGNGNMGTVYLAGTTRLYSYGAVTDFTFENNFTKEGTSTAILEKADSGAITLSGNVSLDRVKLTGGTLNLAGDLSLSGKLSATKGSLVVSGGNVSIGGGLTVGDRDDTGRSADVVFKTQATIKGGIQVDRGTLTFENGATLNGTLDISNGGNAVGHIVVSGGTVTNSGTIWSKGADNYIRLQDGGTFIHENLEYSVRSGLSEGESTRLYTTENERISISLGAESQKTVISNAAINVLGTGSITVTAALSNVDITNQAGEGMTFAGKDKTIRNLLDYTGHAISNSAALTVTGTLSLSGTLVLTGTGSLTFNAANLVLDHGMSGFDSVDGSTSGYSQGTNGYITGNSFVIIDGSANAGGLHIEGGFAEDSCLSLSNGKVVYSVTSENANTYYINEDAAYSSVVWKEGESGHLVWVSDGHTLTLDRDFDASHRLATAYEGWVALGDGVTVSNFGQTPADVDNIKVKTGEHATISGIMTAIEPINTLLENGSILTVESGAQHTGALNFGNLTLADGSTLSTDRDINATLVSAAGGDGGRG